MLLGKDLFRRAPLGAMSPAAPVERDQRVRAQQARLLWKSPVPQLSNLVNAAIVCGVTWHYTQHKEPVAWAGIMAAVVLLRFYYWVQYRRQPMAPEDVDHWLDLHTLCSGLTACLWGLSAWLVFLVDSFTVHVFLAVVISGMGAGAVAANSAYKPTLYAYLLPSSVPLAVAFLAQGEVIYLAMAFMTVLFIGLLSLIGTNLNRSLLETFGLQLDKSALVEDLERARRQLESRVVERTAKLQAEIAGHKQTEQALHESETRFRSVVDNCPAAIFLKDTAGRYLLVNKQFETWYGVSADDALGKIFHEVFPKNYADSFVAHDQEALTSRRVITREREFLHADGTVHLIISTKVPVLGDAGEPMGIITIDSDITEVKQSEAALIAAKEEAELANRAKSEFLANMSHELRTPLNAVIGFAQIIETEKPGQGAPRNYREYAKEISGAGQHLLKLINDILDLSKIEAGRMGLNEEPVDVNRAIRSCVVMVQSRARDGGVTLAQNTAEQLLPLYADERMVKQILVNLLSNAVKFTPQGGSISVEAWFHPGDGHMIQISDTGIGIAVDDIPRALTRFVQLEDQLNRNYEGTGLGLPLSKSLVELHGGSLDLQSEVGVGTTVTVRFPAERTIQSATNSNMSRTADLAAG